LENDRREPGNGGVVLLYYPSVHQRRHVQPTRRTSLRKARSASRVTATTLALALLVGGCSGNDEDGGKKTTSTTAEAAVTTTALAPLAKGAELWELAYLSTDEKQTTVFLTDGKGSETDVVAKVDGRAEVLRWSPDGSKLLLDGDATGDFEIAIIDAASGEAQAVAPSLTSNEGGAAWSPDGRSIAFFSNRDGGFAGYVAPAAGGEPVRVSPPEAEGVGDLAWSPDGTRIAFSTSFGVDSDVWVVNADGTDPKKVSTLAGSTQPAWSPDGDLLVISAQPVGAESAGIFTLDPVTGTTEELTNTEFRDAFPVWSPDGRFIYFVSAVANDDADGGAADDILRVDLDGGEPEPVISDPISVESEIALSPDGLLLAFAVQRLGDKEVFVANADGTGAIPVSRSERIDAWAAWRPGTGPDAPKG